MSNYLKHKPGSIEEIVAKQGSYKEDSGYQAMFKKELDKAGKGIGSMSPAEKKAFFNKIDKKYTAKNEEVELNEKASMAKMYTKKASNGDVEVFYRGRTKYGNNKQIGYYHKQGSKFVTYHDNSDDEDDFTQSDTFNDERSAQMTILQTAAKNRVITEGIETMVPTKKDDEKDMNRKVTMTGEKPTKVDTKPKVDYNK